MIREVVIKRFKSFEEARFDLRGHVILAGPNNCGKTTVLQALAAWALALKTWRLLNDFNVRRAYTKAPLARLAFSAVAVRSYDLLWQNRHYAGTFTIEVVLDDGTRVEMEFHRDSTEQIYVRPSHDADPNKLAQLDIDMVYVATIGGLSLEEPVYQPDYIRNLLGRQRPGDVVRNLLLQASQSSRWDKLTGAVQRLFGLEVLVPQTHGGQIVCEYRKDAHSPAFDILSAGSGFQQVLLLLACLFTREGSVVLVDEPDAHLHVFLQDTIFAELNRAAAETGSQLLIATHSEVIFNSAAPEQITVMMGQPRRLADVTDVQRLQKAVTVLQQSDLVAALESPGILYLDGYTDLNLLREFAVVLEHPLQDYFNQRPFWRGKQHPIRPGGTEVPPKEHFDALQLVRENISGVWVIDSDGKGRIPASDVPETGKLNRIAWNRYEIEGYLMHPAVLARFIDDKAGSGGLDAVRRFLVGAFDRMAGAGLGEQIADAFIADPSSPAEIVETFLAKRKARTEVIGAILEEGGVHGFHYTNFGEIALMMKPEEIHPEVIEKLNFIQAAFGL